MKQFLTLFLLTLSIFSTRVESSSSIHWLTQYEEGIKQAKDQSKPILLYFTGSDWCYWCQKLDNDALETPAFAKLTQDKFIFVKLDFPAKTQLSEEESEQNQELQRRFNVRGFPTIILLNSKGEQIGITGYRPGDGEEYAKHLLRIVKDYSGYQEQVLSLNEKKFSGTQLKSLYEMAKTYHAKQEETAILQRGMDSDESTFFMLEKLRDLAKENKLNTKDALELKDKLLRSDPDNVYYIHFDLAVIEFEGRYQEMKEGKRSSHSTIAPLTSYIDKFGAWDNDHVWKLKMIISQVLYDHHDFKEALKYAEDSQKAAPSSHQSDIAEVIADINSQLEYYR